MNLQTTVRRKLRAAEAAERSWLRLSDEIAHETAGIDSAAALDHIGHAFTQAMRARDRHLKLRDDYLTGRLG